jgi:hypothetical protein
VTGTPDRHRQPRQRDFLRRAESTVWRRVQYWQHSRLVRRLQAADVINQGLLVSAVLLVSFLPLLLVIESLAAVVAHRS